MNPMSFKSFQVNYFLFHDTFLLRFVLSWSKKNTHSSRGRSLLISCKIWTMKLSFCIDKSKIICTGRLSVIEDSIFWPVYINLTFLVFGIAYGSIAIKKFKEKFKEYKLQTNIQINLRKLISTNGQNQSQENILRFNNSKYNGPLLNSVQFLGLGTIIFIVGGFFSFLYFYDDVFSETDDTMKRYQTFVFRRFFYFGFLFSVVFPILYLATKKDLRRFIILMYKDLM